MSLRSGRSINTCYRHNDCSGRARAGSYGRPRGKVDGKATKLPGGHFLNAGAAILSIMLLLKYVNGAEAWTLVVMTLAAFFIGYHLIMGHWRR